MILIRALPCLVAILFSDAALAASCLIRVGSPDAPLNQCHDYGSSLSAKHGAEYDEKLGGSSPAEVVCNATNNQKIDSGKTLHTEYREGKCPSGNVVLRCALPDERDDVLLIMNYYGDASMRAFLTRACKDAKGKVLD